MLKYFCESLAFSETNKRVSVEESSRWNGRKTKIKRFRDRLLNCCHFLATKIIFIKIVPVGSIRCSRGRRMDREPCHDIQSHVPASNSRSLDSKCQGVMYIFNVSSLPHSTRLSEHPPPFSSKCRSYGAYAISDKPIGSIHTHTHQLEDFLRFAIYIFSFAITRYFRSFAITSLCHEFDSRIVSIFSFNDQTFNDKWNVASWAV